MPVSTPTHPGWYLCCKPEGGKADLGEPGDFLGCPSEVPLESRGRNPDRGSGAQKLKFLINLIKIVRFPVIKCSFCCDFVINEYDVSID